MLITLLDVVSCPPCMLSLALVEIAKLVIMNVGINWVHLIVCQLYWPVFVNCNIGAVGMPCSECTDAGSKQGVTGT